MTSYTEAIQFHTKETDHLERMSPIEYYELQGGKEFVHGRRTVFFF